MKTPLSRDPISEDVGQQGGGLTRRDNKTHWPVCPPSERTCGIAAESEEFG